MRTRLRHLTPDIRPTLTSASRLASNTALCLAWITLTVVTAIRFRPDSVYAALATWRSRAAHHLIERAGEHVGPDVTDVVIAPRFGSIPNPMMGDRHV
ncbi:hypothetical protein [Embleya sp. NPDC005575]|uniref:hypothetical protein n=1 Tax=Embleya sp. NPDC005575 TaxID=3156892 RepID=UPI0033AC9D28